MALSLQAIITWCETNHKEFWEYMLYDDMRERNISREESVVQMQQIFEAMEHAINTYEPTRLSNSKLVGGNGDLLDKYFNNEYNESNPLKPLCGSFTGEAMTVALKMAEANACMQRIVAAPTAGSCGVIPAVLIPFYRQKKHNKDNIIKALYVCGAIGQVISERAGISGAAGGCQAEIGAASAMAAGALTFLQGGSAKQICHAAALALKGLLGLVCDPVGGLVEVPCVKRNVLGTVNAIACTDMVMAGIISKIPPDEVIDAMAEIGEKMDCSLKETSIGGLAATPTGMRYKKACSKI